MIAIAAKDKEAVLTLQEILYYRGFIAPVKENWDAAAINTQDFSLLVTLCGGGDCGENALAERLRQISLPTLSLSPERLSIVRGGPYDLSDEIKRAALKADSTPPGAYKLFSLDASADAGRALFCGEELPLTKTERMILAYLLRSYPGEKSASDVLTGAFRASRLPRIDSVRTHLSSINQKLRAFGIANAVLPSRRGYLLNAKEIERAEKIRREKSGSSE